MLRLRDSGADGRTPARSRWLVAALATVIVVQVVLLATRGSSREIAYSDFLQAVQDGEVADVVVAPDRISGRLVRPQDGAAGKFTTMRVDPGLAQDLARAGVRFSGTEQGSWWGTLLSWLVPPLAFTAMWLLLMRGAGRGAGDGFGAGLLSIGRSRARMFAETGIEVKFDDVAGVDEAKAELQEVVDFLRNPASHSRLGARMPKGILLVGPPGTGKTLLARAVAGQAKVPFFSINGSEFVELFVGVGASRVRDLFEQARRSAPAIVFIDEIDALGRARGAVVLGGGDETEQTLNQLLAEMDGFDPRSGVIVLAATNRPEVLDPALLRAGRFDRQVLLDPPDRRGRVQILRVHLRGVHCGPDLEPDAIAALTPGFTGADLANLVNEAALVATRRGADGIGMADFTDAVERIVAGLERRSRILGELERRVIAAHEMGHALAAIVLPGSDKVHKVTIIPRGIGALGHTLQRPTEDRSLFTRAELENRMAVLLAGRAAEKLVVGDVSTGAEADLARATDIARSMVMRFGMDDDLGLVAYERAPQPLLPLSPELRSPPRTFSDATGRAIDAAIQHLTGVAYQRALELLQQRRALLQQASEQLLHQESIEGAELERLVRSALVAAEVQRVPIQ